MNRTSCIHSFSILWLTLLEWDITLKNTFSLVSHASKNSTFEYQRTSGLKSLTSSIASGLLAIILEYYYRDQRHFQLMFKVVVFHPLVSEVTFLFAHLDRLHLTV